MRPGSGPIRSGAGRGVRVRRQSGAGRIPHAPSAVTLGRPPSNRRHSRMRVTARAFLPENATSGGSRLANLPARKVLLKGDESDRGGQVRMMSAKRGVTRCTELWGFVTLGGGRRGQRQLFLVRPPLCFVDVRREVPA